MANPERDLYVHIRVSLEDFNFSPSQDPSGLMSLMQFGLFSLFLEEDIARPPVGSPP